MRVPVGYLRQEEGGARAIGAHVDRERSACSAPPPQQPRKPPQPPQGHQQKSLWLPIVRGEGAATAPTEAGKGTTGRQWEDEGATERDPPHWCNGRGRKAGGKHETAGAAEAGSFSMIVPPKIFAFSEYSSHVMSVSLGLESPQWSIGFSAFSLRRSNAVNGTVCTWKVGSGPPAAVCANECCWRAAPRACAWPRGALCSCRHFSAAGTRPPRRALAGSRPRGRRPRHPPSLLWCPAAVWPRSGGGRCCT